MESETKVKHEWCSENMEQFYERTLFKEQE